VDEFALIRRVVDALGSRAQGRWVKLGPGDDSAIIDQTPGCQAVASIDTLVAGVHFPADLAAADVGYRALMVALSDLAAMAATPRYVLVALTLPEPDGQWVAELAQGMANAAQRCDTYVCGGNFARGQLSITVSVHGEIPVGQALTRAGALAGDYILVSGALGGAAACVRLQEFDFAKTLSACQLSYLKPQARFDLLKPMRKYAHAAIDVSDGLSKDLEHLCNTSLVQARLVSAEIPLTEGATLADALTGGDDYEILCTAGHLIPGFTCIGQIAPGSGVYLDGEPLDTRGYNHFGT
jgi:thiamine-monophosphate kinase